MFKSGSKFIRQMMDHSKRVDLAGACDAKPNACWRMVLFLLVVVAVCLCGCASERSAISTKGGTIAPASVRKVDYRGVPEVRELTERAREIGNEMYPKVLAVLGADTSKVPQQFDIIFKKHLKPNLLGRTLGKRIHLDADRIQKDPDKLDGVLIHEMAHLTQELHWYRPFDDAWKCWMEGIPDYVRFKLGYTNGWRCPQCSFELPHYTYGYSCAGAFLLFVDQMYGSNVVRQLNTELQRRVYSDKFFAKVTGKSLDELWLEFQKTPGFTPVAAKVDKLYNALGYRNGKPPRNVRDRFTAYLKQQGDEAHFVLARDYVHVESDFALKGETTKSMHAALEMNGPVANDVLRLYAVYQSWQDGSKAAAVLVSLGDKGQLPGFPEDKPSAISGKGPAGLDLESDCEIYPASRTFFCTKNGDPDTYHYVMVQASEDSAWKLQRAWRTAADGRIVEEYPVQ